jgi:hypothetical protein
LGEQTDVAIAKDTNNKDLIKNMAYDFSGSTFAQNGNLPTISKIE